MALNSIIESASLASPENCQVGTVSAWKTAIPVVIFGAPLGAFMAARTDNAVILYALVVSSA
ncbi:MAG: hypothetical protein H6556_05165 [Lewinellaceae bacterium]|nr:hypothetical protein [Lewinellaceae bacterium]